MVRTLKVTRNTSALILPIAVNTLTVVKVIIAVTVGLANGVVRTLLVAVPTQAT